MSVCQVWPPNPSLVVWHQLGAAPVSNGHKMRRSRASRRVLGGATLCSGLLTSSKPPHFPGHSNWLLTGTRYAPTSSHLIHEGELHFKALLFPSLLLTMFWKRLLFLLKLLEGSQSLGSEPLFLLLPLPGVTATS